mgnify:CR=1 FL=1
MEIEQHPLEPFLPGNARLLMLGSFPSAKKTLVHGVLLPELE